ncbi:aminotransferase class I/II-fold pyridoxal phosphate-dependent enzyme, partial [Candidatus Bathyarchaeota archaeon]|nr:aminotransferase class I/II-fold pyridoxal phosphate-dependent enzyme [Candidatus Bathyarchaeota archaeon]
MSERLEKYRKEIAEIDSQILRLVKDRMQVAKTIGDEKKRQNLPITNLKAESDVNDRAIKLAREIGLDETIASKLIGMLISGALEVQGSIPKNRSAFLYDIFEKVNGLEAKGEKVIKLEVGEPDLWSPVEFKDAVKNTLYESNFVGYSSSKGLGQLRDAIADNLNQTYGTDIDGEQVLITPGGKFAIFAAILSLVSLGDHVIIPEPTWPV